MRGKLTQVLCHAGFSLFRSESLYVETPRNSPFPRETEQKKTMGEHQNGNATTMDTAENRDKRNYITRIHIVKVSQE